MASFYFDGNKLRIYEVPTNSTYTVDGSGYRIYTPTDAGEAIVRIDIQRDLWSRSQDYLALYSWSYVPFTRSGGAFRGFDELGNPRYQTNDYQLLTSIGWRIVLANYPHEAIFRGNLFATDTSSLFDTSRLTSQGVVARMEGFDSLQVYQVSTGGVTPEQVWTYSSRSLSSSGNSAVAVAVENQLADDFAGVSASIDPQDIRDAMKLAPSSGTPEEGSIDEMLELAKDQSTIAARNTQT